MHLEGPLKKKYDRKCVPVRRVSAWEREQIEKRQSHLKNFKGVKWQKLHREDELRRAKAVAEGIRYVRLSSVRSSSTAPNRVSRVSQVAARRTRGVRFTAKKKNSHKPRRHLTHHQHTKTSTDYKIAHATYRPAPKKYRYRRPPPPPTPVTLFNLQKFIMDERRERRGRDDRDVKPVESVFRQLFESIEKDATSKVVKAQAQLIQRLRMKAPVHQTNPVLDRAEKQLFQLVKDRGDPSDITLQSEKVQSLRANPTPTAPAAAGKDAHKRPKPTKADQRREAAGPPPAPGPADKDAREGSDPAKREHVRARETAGHSAAPAAPIHERPKPAQAGQESRRADTPVNASTRHKYFLKLEANEPSLAELYDLPSPPRQARQPVPAPTPDHGNIKENEHLEAPTDAGIRHKKSPKSQASASSVAVPLDPPSPPCHTAWPIPEPKPALVEKQENKRPSEQLHAGTSHRPPTKPQTSASSVGGSLDPPSPVRHARQSSPAPKPSQVDQQENKQLGVPLEPDTRHKPPPRSIASASFIGDPLEAPSPPQLARQPIPALKPSHLNRQQNERPSTAPEAGARTNKQPHFNASTSSIGSRFDLPIQPPRIPKELASSPPQRGRQPISALKPSPLHQQETARPSTAPEPSAPSNKRPHSHASTSSFGSRFNSPSQPSRRSQAPAPSPPQRGRQPLPFPRPSQLPRQENARPSTAPESSAATNKRPRSSASVSSRTSTVAVPHSPERGRQRERIATPPPRPPKRRRADTQQSPDNYPRSDSPSPPPPRAPGIPPRPRFIAKYSITDKEDRASRALMHPASKPLAKLPDAARLMTGDFDQVAKVHKPHPSFEKAKLNANNKHVRHVNRAGGRRREVVEEERSLADRIGTPPAMAQAWEAERAQAAAAGSARGGAMVPGGVARGREEAMKLIDEEFGPGGGEEGGGVL